MATSNNKKNFAKKKATLKSVLFQHSKTMKDLVKKTHSSKLAHATALEIHRLKKKIDAKLDEVEQFDLEHHCIPDFEEYIRDIHLCLFLIAALSWEEDYSNYLFSVYSTSPRSNDIRVFSANINSMYKNASKIRELAGDCDVLVLTETLNLHLPDDPLPNQKRREEELNEIMETIFQDFIIVRADRTPVNNRNPGGGVAVLLRKEITLLSRDKRVAENAFEAVSCELEIKGNPIRIVGIYKENKAADRDVDKLNVYIGLQISRLPKLPVIFVGDYNFKDAKWDPVGTNHSTIDKPTTIGVKKFVEVCKKHKLHQLVPFPTRGKSILDLVLTTEKEMVKNVTRRGKVSKDHNSLSFEVCFNGDAADMNNTGDRPPTSNSSQSDGSDGIIPAPIKCKYSLQQLWKLMDRGDIEKKQYEQHPNFMMLFDSRNDAGTDFYQCTICSEVFVGGEQVVKHEREVCKAIDDKDQATIKDSISKNVLVLDEKVAIRRALGSFSLQSGASFSLAESDPMKQLAFELLKAFVPTTDIRKEDICSMFPSRLEIEKEAETIVKEALCKQ